jgi:D-amino-acid dehydrogenase
MAAILPAAGDAEGGLLYSLLVNAHSSDAVVVGGGLVGLSLAYELSGQGATVTLVDAAHEGRATDAGAGILSPDTTADPSPYWWELVQAAGRNYPRLLDQLDADGADISGAQYARCGLLSFVRLEHEREWFAPFADVVLGRSGAVVEEISAERAHELFWPLGEVSRALHNPAAARVDGRGMAAALRQGAERRGVRLVAGQVTGVATEQAAGPGSLGRIRAVQLAGRETVPCGALAVAGGAWSAAMGEWLQAPLPITPTKGQIVHLRVGAENDGRGDDSDSDSESDTWPIVQPFLTHYLVPWPGGRIACGGTFEVGAGFSSAVTVQGLHELLRECLSVAPGLAQAEYLFTRVGLRPTSADDRPLVGAVPGWANAWVVTGHGANGLLLGPYGARQLSAQITGEEEGVLPVAPELAPARFLPS